MSETIAASDKLSFAENFLLSGSAAIISKTVAAPIERVKLLVQNQGEMLKSGRLKEPYKGVLDCTRRVYVEEGIVPFWRGNLANCIRYFPTQALNFAFKDKIKEFFNFKKTDTQVVQFAKNVGSGGAAGAASLLFVYSLDFARTRLASDNKAAKKAGGVAERQYKGLIDVYKKTLASDGLPGLYRGFVVSCAGIIVYRGAYFGLYDTLKPLLLGKDAGLGVSFLLGYGVTVTAGLLSYPVDTIRRRMMMTSGEAVKYSGALDCTMQIFRKEGVGAFFKGAGANILRGIAGAGVLSGFDSLQKFYIKLKEENSGHPGAKPIKKDDGKKEAPKEAPKH